MIERWAAPLLRLFRDRSNSIEQRIFQGITLTAGLLSLLVVVPLNIVQKLPLMMSLSAGALGLTALGLFFATLRGFYGMKTLFLLFMLDLDLSWFANGGSEGSIGLFFFPAVMYLVTFFKGLTRWFLLALYLVNGLGLLWLEWSRPKWIWQFPNAWSRVLDLGTGFIVCSVMCVLILWMVLASYHRERQRLAESLEAQGQSEARFRALVMQAPVPIALSSAQGRIEYVNRAFEQVLGYSLEDLPDVRTWWEKAYPDAALREQISTHWTELITQALATRASVRPEEYQVTAKDGRLLHLEIQAAAIGDQWLVMFTDVSERRRSEEAMRQTQKLESLGVLAGGIAHDFNNLLTAILGNVSMAQMCLSQTSPAAPYLENMERTVHRASNLTRQMLAYSGRGQFTLGPLSLNHAVEEVSHLLSVSISKKVSLRYQFQEELPWFQAEASQIQQVIMNLVTNASEAIGEAEGSVTIRTGLHPYGAQELASDFPGQAILPGSFLSLEVADTGQGMSPEVQARIFEPFFTTKFTGRGLGLSAMQGIIRGHRGGIRVQSEVGRGSTFQVILPAGMGLALEPEAATPEDSWRGEGTVLVVDDEESVRLIAAELLRSLGFDVVAAADGVEALDCYRRLPIRAVLTDLTMPRMGGLETFRELRRLDPACPVVLISGYNEQEVIQDFLGQGLAAFVQKPFVRADLMRAMRVALEG